MATAGVENQVALVFALITLWLVCTALLDYGPAECAECRVRHDPARPCRRQ